MIYRSVSARRSRTRRWFGGGADARLVYREPSPKMTTTISQGTFLDVLRNKMRQTKEEMEKYKDECEEYHRRLQLEVMRREEVRYSFIGSSTGRVPCKIVV